MTWKKKKKRTSLTTPIVQVPTRPTSPEWKRRRKNQDRFPIHLRFRKRRRFPRQRETNVYVVFQRAHTTSLEPYSDDSFSLPTSRPTPPPPFTSKTKPPSSVCVCVCVSSYVSKSPPGYPRSLPQLEKRHARSATPFPTKTTKKEKQELCK